jgi:Domain of unknown function (DUF1707)
MQPSMRVSDADRQHVTDALHEHTVAGRLSLDEFTTRIDAAQRATTHGDLAALTADLPTPAKPAAVSRWRPSTAVLVAGIVIAVLLIIAVVVGLVGMGSMGSMMSGGH